MGLADRFGDHSDISRSRPTRRCKSHPKCGDCGAEMLYIWLRISAVSVGVCGRSAWSRMSIGHSLGCSDVAFSQAAARLTEISNLFCARAAHACTCYAASTSHTILCQAEADLAAS